MTSDGVLLKCVFFVFFKMYQFWVQWIFRFLKRIFNFYIQVLYPLYVLIYYIKYIITALTTGVCSNISPSNMSGFVSLLLTAANKCCRVAFQTGSTSISTLQSYVHTNFYWNTMGLFMIDTHLFPWSFAVLIWKFSVDDFGWDPLRIVIYLHLPGAQEMLKREMILNQAILAISFIWFGMFGRRFSTRTIPRRNFRYAGH